MRKSTLYPLVAGFLLAGCASSPPYYYNKAGVAPSVFSADREECASLAKGGGHATSHVPPASGSGTAATVAGAGVTGFMEGMERGRMKRAAFSKCMSVKGYVKRALSAEEESKLRKLSGQDLQQKLSELASDENPSHPILSDQ